MKNFGEIYRAFRDAYDVPKNYQVPLDAYMRLFIAFADGWNAKPVNKIGRPKGKAAPKSKKAKES